MSLPLALAFLWCVAANVIGMLPSRDHHWRAAYGLIALGVPLVGWVTWVNGPWVGLLVLAAGVSVLRWPAWFLWRWMTGRSADRGAPPPSPAGQGSTPEATGGTGKQRG